MASQTIIMGMVFDESEAPDFGSIYCSRLRGGATFTGVNEYGLKAEDVAKLDLITNAPVELEKQDLDLGGEEKTLRGTEDEEEQHE